MDKRSSIASDLSLFNKFKPGDRVKRKSNNNIGRTEEYKGIIMTMDNAHLEVYWDTKNNSYCPDRMDKEFTRCSIDEVLYGTIDYSPIKKIKNLY